MDERRRLYNHGTCHVPKPALCFLSKNSGVLIQKAGKDAIIFSTPAILFTNRPIIENESIMAYVEKTSDTVLDVIISVTSNNLTAHDYTFPNAFSEHNGFWCSELRLLKDHTDIQCLLKQNTCLIKYGGKEKSIRLSPTSSILYLVIMLKSVVSDGFCRVKFMDEIEMRDSNVSPPQFFDTVLQRESEWHARYRNVTEPLPRSDDRRDEEIIPYEFSTTVGCSIHRFDEHSVIRTALQTDRGYCFLDRPLQLNEMLAVKIMAVKTEYRGCMTFGLTTCDPSTIDPESLPVDAFDLLQRSEYWTVIKNVGFYQRQGTILEFVIEPSGRVTMTLDGSISQFLMCVDASVPLYPFFDLYGSVAGITLIPPQSSFPLFSRSSSDVNFDLDNIPDSHEAFRAVDSVVNVPFVVPDDDPRPSTSQVPAQTLLSKVPSSSENTELKSPSECIICMSNPVATVIYRCGHACFCSGCADSVRSQSHTCPVCRQAILDIIPFYCP